MHNKCENSKQIEELEERVDKQEKRLDIQEKTLKQLVSDVMKIWHIAIGVGIGLVLEKFGIDKLLSKLL
jgi:hypothetical protein